MKKIIIIALVIFAFTQCSTSKKTSDNTDSGTVVAKEGIVTSEDLAQGQNLYVNNCGKCHEIYAPSAYTKAGWAKWVGKMKGNTDLTDAQAELVLDYLESGASDN